MYNDFVISLLAIQYDTQIMCVCLRNLTYKIKKMFLEVLEQVSQF